MKNIEKLIHKARNNSLVSSDRLRVLDKFAKQALYLEGNFWETGNNYHIFLFYNEEQLGGYDKIIGYKQIYSGDL